MRRKRVTIWLYSDQLEFLSELRAKLKNRVSEAECIRFCINLANVMLNYYPYTEEMAGILAEALEETLEKALRRGKTSKRQTKL